MVRLDGADILPIAVENVGLHAMAVDAAREDLLTEVGGQRRLIEQVEKRLAREKVNSHARQIAPAFGVDTAVDHKLIQRDNRLKLLGRLRLFDETDDAAGVVESGNAEMGGVFGADGKDRNGDIGVILTVGLQ